MDTAKVPRKVVRHRQTSIDFKKWLETNPNASLKRKVHAFNAIADSNYRKMRERSQKVPT